MKKTLFIKNAAVLTAASLFLRFAGIVFKVWLAKKIGADGIGLYGLVFSLYAVAAAGTSGGLPVAVTRLVAEAGESGAKNHRRILSVALAVNLAISFIISAVLFFGADFLAGGVIADSRAALALKVLSFSVVFMGFGSAIRGYFIARRNATPNAISLILEQSCRISIALLAIRLTRGAELSYICAAVFAGDTVSQIISCLFLYLRYRYDLKKQPEGNVHAPRILRRMAGISAPITAGKYLNSILRAAENMLVPRALYRFSKKGALALFGMIKGMALPILFFPSVLLNAISALLVPEMSEAALHRKTFAVRSAVEQIVRGAAITGFIFSALFACSGYRIGFLLYKSADVGFLITALAPIVPLMYLDSLCDGLLKGLNQQNFTFWVSVTDSALRLLFVFPVLSRFGIKGFLVIMYFSNLFTAFLNVRRLIKISRAAIDTQKTVLTPILCAFCITLLAKIALDAFRLSDLVYIMLMSSISVPIYALFMAHFGCIDFRITGRMRTHKRYAAKTTATSLIK